MRITEYNNIKHRTLIGIIYNETIVNKGVSYKINTNEINPKDGYMVSLVNYEKVIPIINFDVMIIHQYLMDNLKILKIDNVFLGTWVDNDKVYLDVTIKATSLSSSIRIGKENNQKAIFDNRNGNVIEL